MSLVQVTELTVGVDFFQVYIFDLASPGADIGNGVLLRALDDANQSGRGIGVSDGLIDVLAPVRFNYEAPMRVEVLDGEPADDIAEWDHVVDLDFDAPSGKVAFLESGETEIEFVCEVPVGRYRSRVSVTGYDHPVLMGGGLDSYRLQLWPRGSDQEPVMRKARPRPLPG